MAPVIPLQTARAVQDAAVESTAWRRIRLAASSVWPDAYVAALVGVAGVVGLITRDGVERLTIAKIISSHATDAYVSIIVAACVVIVVSITLRKPIPASRGAIVLSLMLGLNGLALYIEFKGAAVLTMVVYFAAALLVMNRSFVLRHRALVPWWLAEIAAPPRRRR
jgi:hypothetical protein